MSPSKPSPRVATLAFSIGAAVSTWSLLSAVLLRPLPVTEPDRLVVMSSLRIQGPSAGFRSVGFIYPVLGTIRDSGTFAQTAAQWTPPSRLLVSNEGLRYVGFATHDFLDVLGVKTQLGRAFSAEEDRRGVAPVAILTDRYWRQAFNADLAIVGQTLAVAGTATTVIGVTAPGFRGLDLTQAPDLYLPFHTIGDVAPGTNYFADPDHSMSPTAGTVIVGRLRPNESIGNTQTRLSTLKLPSASATQATIELTDANTAAIPAAARPAMARFSLLLGSTVALLLVIGCGTVGLLLLVRTEERRVEFATCLALGASRARLARGIALEGALLAAAGAGVSVPVAWLIVNAARSLQLPGGINIGLLELSLDGRTLIGAAVGAVVATLGMAILTGAVGFSGNLLDALRSRSGVTPPLRRRATRSALVITQAAVALTLVAGAGLFTRSLVTALGLNTDLDAGRIVTGTVSLAPYGYDDTRAATFFDDLSARLRANPAIRSMTYSVAQGGMTSLGHILVDGAPRQFASMVSSVSVDDAYFETMGIRVVAGRSFSADDRGTATPVAIVSESLARQLAGGESAVGHRIAISTAQPGDVREVVGVVKDVVTNVTVLEPLVLYAPLEQGEGSTFRSITARAAADADVTRIEITAAIRALDPSIMPAPFLTLDERILQQMAPQYFGALVLGSLGFIAIVLTLLGTYVVAESMAVARTREMGIRAALGARGGELARIVLGESARLVAIGLAIGLGLVWAGANTIRAFLFGVEPLDLTTLATAAVLIFMLALVMSLRPAMRATRVHLGMVLRGD
jgi:predicted permease